MAFYSHAFGYAVRRLDESHKWGELESGATTIAFTPVNQQETDDLTGSEVQIPRMGHERNQVEDCFDYLDVDAAYKRAVDNGAVQLVHLRRRTGARKSDTCVVSIRLS